MSHVKLWCLELLFIPGGQVRPCYSLVNTITAIQAVWLSASSSLLPFCPHRGQLSQPQCSTWGTQRHSPITASEGLGGNHAMSQKGAYTYLGTGEAVPSSAHASMPFHLMVSSGLVLFSPPTVCVLKTQLMQITSITVQVGQGEVEPAKPHVPLALASRSCTCCVRLAEGSLKKYLNQVLSLGSSRKRQQNCLLQGKLRSPAQTFCRTRAIHTEAAPKDKKGETLLTSLQH